MKEGPAHPELEEQDEAETKQPEQEENESTLLVNTINFYTDKQMNGQTDMYMYM